VRGQRDSVTGWVEDATRRGMERAMERTEWGVAPGETDTFYCAIVALIQATLVRGAFGVQAPAVRSDQLKRTCH